MFRLALAIGCHISEIEAMPYSELLEWQAFYSLEPFGMSRDNYHAATIASTIANCHSKRQFKPDDFMLKPECDRQTEKTQGFINFIRGSAVQCPEKSS